MVVGRVVGVGATVTGGGTVVASVGGGAPATGGSVTPGSAAGDAGSGRTGRAARGPSVVAGALLDVPGAAHDAQLAAVQLPSDAPAQVSVSGVYEDEGSTVP